MIDEKIIFWLIPGLLGIIFFFIKFTVFARMNSFDTLIKDIEDKVNDHETKIKVAESNHSSLDKRFDEMNANFNKLADKITEFIMKSAR